MLHRQSMTLCRFTRYRYNINSINVSPKKLISQSTFGILQDARRYHYHSPDLGRICYAPPPSSIKRDRKRTERCCFTIRWVGSLSFWIYDTNANRLQNMLLPGPRCEVRPRIIPRNLVSGRWYTIRTYGWSEMCDRELCTQRRLCQLYMLLDLH